MGDEINPSEIPKHRWHKYMGDHLTMMRKILARFFNTDDKTAWRLSCRWWLMRLNTKMIKICVWVSGQARSLLFCSSLDSFKCSFIFQVYTIQSWFSFWTSVLVARKLNTNFDIDNVLIIWIVQIYWLLIFFLSRYFESRYWHYLND